MYGQVNENVTFNSGKVRKHKQGNRERRNKYEIGRKASDIILDNYRAQYHLIHKSSPAPPPLLTAVILTIL